MGVCTIHTCQPKIRDEDYFSSFEDIGDWIMIGICPMLFVFDGRHGMESDHTNEIFGEY